MKNNRFTESQIVSILKEADAGIKVKDICRSHVTAGMSCEITSESTKGYVRFARDGCGFPLCRSTLTVDMILPMIQ